MILKIQEIIGIDIGGTKCAVIKASANGNIIKKVKFPTENADNTLNRIFVEIENLKPKNAVFGISCGGPLDSNNGLILSPPNLPDWDNIAITTEITNRFGGKAFLMNDANASVLAEWMFGTAKGCQNVVFLTHSTGMGAGIILDGRLYEGTNGNAGEIGHIRLSGKGPVGYGKAGSFEGLCSGSGIAEIGRHLSEELDIQNITAAEIASAAKNGNKKAKEIFNESAEFLGIAVSMIIDILNPQIIVLGSIYTRAQELFEPHLHKKIKEEALPQSLNVCQIVPSELADSIGDYAAISIALYRSNQL